MVHPPECASLPARFFSASEVVTVFKQFLFPPWEAHITEEDWWESARLRRVVCRNTERSVAICPLERGAGSSWQRPESLGEPVCVSVVGSWTSDEPH